MFVTKFIMRIDLPASTFPLLTVSRFKQKHVSSVSMQNEKNCVFMSGYCCLIALCLTGHGITSDAAINAVIQHFEEQ